MQNLHTNGYRGLTHNHQILQTTEMSFNRLMDQPTIGHSYNGLLFYSKNNNNWEEFQMYHAE